MIPHKQFYRHKPDEGIWGDCYRTVFACLLDLLPSAVPHVFDEGRGPEEANAILDAWLAERDLAKVRILYPGEIGLSNVLMTIKNTNPGIYYVVGGQSRTGVDHVVICLDDMIVHDPSLTDAGIIGPTEQGYFEVVFLIPRCLVAGAKKADAA